MDFDLGKRVMNVVTLAMLVWRLFAPGFEPRGAADDGLGDALAQLTGTKVATAHATVFAPEAEPYLACATAADALAMEFQCMSFTNRSSS